MVQFDSNGDGKDDITGQPVLSFADIMAQNAHPEAAAQPATPSPVVTPPPAETPVTPPALVPAQMTVKSPETTTTSYPAETTTRQKVISPQEKALQGQQLGLDQEALDLQKKQGELGKQKADYLSQQAAEQKVQADAKQAELAAVTTRAADDMTKRTAEYDARYNDYKNMKFEDFWDKKGTGTKIIAALAIGLGAYGQAMTGGKMDNTAFKIVQGAIDQDFEKQKAQILKGKDTVGLAKEGIDIARKNKDDALKDLDLKYAAATESVAAKYAEMLARQGIPQAQIDSDKSLIGLKQSAQDRKQKVVEDTRQEVTTQAAKDVTQTTSGGITTVMKPQEAAKPTKGQEATDKDFAKSYQEYISGGSAQVTKNITQLQAARAKLNDMPEPNLAKRAIGALAPEGAQKLLTPKITALKQQVDGVVIQGIKQILPGAISDYEQRSMVDRVFDPAMSKKVNMERLNAFEKQLKDAKAAKDAAVKYFGEHGTLSGFKGKVYTTADFMDLPEEAPAKTTAPKTEAKTEEVERQTADGKTAVFDAATKKFLRYK